MKKHIFLILLLSLVTAFGASAQCAAPIIQGTPKWSGKDKSFCVTVQYDPNVDCYAVQISHDNGVTWSAKIRQQGNIQPIQGKVYFCIPKGSTVYADVRDKDYMRIMAGCDGIIPFGSVDPNILNCGNTENYGTPTAPITVAIH